MNTTPALLAAGALAIALTGCAAKETSSPAQISKPGPDITQHSQPFQPDPPCVNRPCPR